MSELLLYYIDNMIGILAEKGKTVKEEEKEKQKAERNR